MAENYLHFGAVRIRVNGSGILRMQLLGLDGVVSKELATIDMQTSPGNEPRVLSNLKSQRARLKIYTSDINAVFNINRFILFVKSLWTEGPG